MKYFVYDILKINVFYVSLRIGRSDLQYTSSLSL